MQKLDGLLQDFASQIVTCKFALAEKDAGPEGNPLTTDEFKNFKLSSLRTVEACLAAADELIPRLEEMRLTERKRTLIRRAEILRQLAYPERMPLQEMS